MAGPDWIGIAIGAAFAIVGIYLTVRRAKYPGRLVFIRRQSIALLNSSATRLPNLTLTYKDAPIGKSVVLISGYIANDGAIDIAPADVEVPLTCELPGGCTWLEFTVTSATPELTVTASPQGSTAIVLQFGQFRRDESFAFQALAQMDDEHSKKHASAFTSLLKWRHRIAGVGVVKQTQLLPLPTPSLTWKVVRTVGALILGGFAVMIGLNKFGVGLRYPVQPIIAFEYKDGSETAVYDVKPTRLGSATLTRLDNGAEKSIDLEEALKAHALNPVRIIPKRDDGSVVAGVLFILFGISIVVLSFVGDPTQKRLHRLVAASKQGARG